jgi:hypothetical protein
MKYKYNITHKLNGKKTTINFKNEQSLIKHLNTHQNKVNKLENVYINFSAVSLPLKATVWNEQSKVKAVEVMKPKKKPRKKTARSKAKAAEKRRLRKFIKQLES